jgi:anti-sigma regulatory factor (Ser/Thr protein kinase)
MCQRHETTLVEADTAPAEARRVVRRQCAEMGYDDLADDAVLLTSELVTNAMQHGRGPLTLRTQSSHGLLRVEVQDRAPQLPQLRKARIDAQGGRGLTLVSSVAEEWGVQELPGGDKTVWFTLRPKRPPPQAASCTCPERPVAAAIDLTAADRTMSGVVSPPRH